MLKQPPRDVLGAMRLLIQTDPDFKRIVAWLQGQREDAVKTLSVSRDQWSAAQHQGCVQTLDDLLGSIEMSTR